MSAPVDVLLVLDVLIRRAEFTGTDIELPLPNVRAAVAELILVAQGMLTASTMLAHGATHGMPGQDPEGARRHCEHACERLESALARVRGGA